jgi:hypothetical protein
MNDTIPLMNVGDAEQAVPLGAAQPVLALPPPVNYATHEATKNFVLHELIPLIEETRMQRRVIEEGWRSVDAMVDLIHTFERRYMGRSNVYLPVYRKIRSTRISQLSRGLFPSDDYLDVAALEPGREPDAEAGKAYLQWELDINAKLRTRIKPFLASFEDYGTGVMKYWYAKELMPRGRGGWEKLASGVMAPTHSMEQYSCEGFRVSPRNLYNFYVYPATAQSLDEASLAFEDIRVPREELLRMQALKRWANVDTALADSTETNPNVRDQQADRGFADIEGSQKDTPLGGIKTVTEVWVMMPLPDKAYVNGEQPGTWLPTRVVICGKAVLLVERNPTFLQKPPYLVARQDTKAGLFYGTGTGFTVRGLQHLINDFSNQTNDCGQYSLNPLALINPGQVVGPFPALSPGAVIRTTDPQKGVNFIRPPAELIQYGSQLQGTYMGLMMDFSGAPPVLQGTKGAGTATSTQILQHNASAPLQDIVEDIENEVMVPLMEAAWFLGQQFRDKTVMAMVAGRPVEVRPEQLSLRAQFRWLASSQAANRAQRASQAMQLIQAVAPLVPLLQQTGYQVDFPTLLARIYRDGFGFRDFDKFISKMPMAPMGMPGMPPGAMSPGMPAGAAPMEQEPRSAVDQASMAPGEGEALGEVRAGANELAGMLGGSGGMF